MKPSIQFIGVSVEDLAGIISKEVREEIQSLRGELLIKEANDQLLSREETYKLLGIDQSTLWSWVKKGHLKMYGISGHRRYFKRSEVMEALQLKK